jgi:hypothetical protein
MRTRNTTAGDDSGGEVNTVAEPSRRSVLAVGGAAIGAGALGLVVPGTAAAATPVAPTPATPALLTRRDATSHPAARVEFTRWTSYADFASGHSDGVHVIPGPRLGVVICEPAGTTTYHDPYLKTTAEYEYSTWLSPLHHLDFGATQLTAHWNADTPAGTFLKMELHAVMEDGHADWWTMGIWASGDTDIYRTSVNGQQNAYAEIDTDTWNAETGHSMRAYQLRLTLYRKPGLRRSPRVWQVGAAASRVPNRTTVPATAPGPACGVTLKVPPYAQNPHAGQYTQYGGGGEAWCSPTSSEMIVEYWGHKPSKRDLAWVNPSYSDPTVDYAARYCYDWGYQGTGNWPFNTGYASRWGMDGMVCRLNNLLELETLIKAGFPVALSVAFNAAELPGSGYSTQGHLFVCIGFTATGDPIVNDPASDSDANVYTVYPRRALEIVWLRTVYTQEDGSPGSGSGGVCYVDKPHDAALPAVLDRHNPSWPGGTP